MLSKNPPFCKKSAKILLTKYIKYARLRTNLFNLKQEMEMRDFAKSLAKLAISTGLFPTHKSESSEERKNWARILDEALSQKRASAKDVDFLRRESLKYHGHSRNGGLPDLYGDSTLPYPDMRYGVVISRHGVLHRLVFDEKFDLIYASRIFPETETVLWERPGARHPELYA